VAAAAHRGAQLSIRTGAVRVAGGSTVRNHITRVFDKIRVEHRYQAIVLAREAGLGRAIRLVKQG